MDGDDSELTEEEIRQNEEDQEDELTVLRSMFDDSQLKISKPRIHIIIYPEECIDEEERKESKRIEIDCILVKSYPSKTFPSGLNVSSKYFRITESHITEMKELFVPENPVIYDWISYLQTTEIPKKKEIDRMVTEEDFSSIDPSKIIVSDTMTLKKSKFISHGYFIKSVKEVRLFLKYLKQSKKIREATHNMYAYRLLDPTSKTVISKAVDNGEKRGGAVILDTLTFRNTLNLLVVVTRWYGGIHLGGTRFKIIKDQTMEIIQLSKT